MRPDHTKEGPCRIFSVFFEYCKVLQGFCKVWYVIIRSLMRKHKKIRHRNERMDHMRRISTALWAIKPSSTAPAF